MGLEQLLPAIAEMTWQDLVMIAIGLILIYLAITKNYEPTLLLPMDYISLSCGPAEGDGV